MARPATERRGSEPGSGSEQAKQTPPSYFSWLVLSFGEPCLPTGMLQYGQGRCGFKPPPPRSICCTGSSVVVSSKRKVAEFYWAGRSVFPGRADAKPAD